MLRHRFFIFEKVRRKRLAGEFPPEKRKKGDSGGKAVQPICRKVVLKKVIPPEKRKNGVCGGKGVLPICRKVVLKKVIPPEKSKKRASGGREKNLRKKAKTD